MTIIPDNVSSQSVPLISRFYIDSLLQDHAGIKWQTAIWILCEIDLYNSLGCWETRPLVDYYIILVCELERWFFFPSDNYWLFTVSIFQPVVVRSIKIYCFSLMCPKWPLKATWQIIISEPNINCYGGNMNRPMLIFRCPLTWLWWTQTKLLKYKCYLLHWLGQWISFSYLSQGNITFLKNALDESRSDVSFSLDDSNIELK